MFARLEDWKAKNPKRVLAAQQRWKDENPEKLKQYRDDYYNNHSEEICQASAERIRKAPEKHQARQRAYYKYPKAQKCSVKGCERKGLRHHPDYSQPDLIEWLCAKHHTLLHKRQERVA
jgi:hypothetical protein